MSSVGESDSKTPSYQTVILITGAREWNNFQVVQKVLKEYKTGDNNKVLLIHGDCRGADKIAGYVGKHLGFELSVKPANWKLYGKRAGVLRNLEMIQEALSYKTKAQQVIVLAFHDNIDKSKGTKHCIEQAKAKGLNVLLYDTN